MGIGVWQLTIIALLFIVVILPWVMVLLSNKASGTDKFIWFILAFFFSWIGYLVYYHYVVKT